MSSSAFQDALQSLVTKTEDLKAVKGSLRDLETDFPVELEELLLQLKDMKKQVKTAKDAFIKSLLEDNVEYAELREKVQTLKEDIAEAKVALFTAAANASREKGDLDETVVVEGSPMRLQTQREVSVYLNGRVLK